jgi:hypothetical protein
MARTDAPAQIRTRGWRIFALLSGQDPAAFDPTQILSTGAALGTAANPLTNAQVYGGGGLVEWRNFLVDGEAYLINVNRQGLATNSFEGGYIATRSSGRSLKVIERMPPGAGGFNSAPTSASRWNQPSGL